MKAEIIKKLEAVLSGDDISAVANQVKSLQREYETIFSKEVEKARMDFISDGGKARDFVFEKSEEDKAILDLLEKFRQMKKAYDASIAQEQQKNYQIKKQVVQDIQDLIKLEVHPSTAFKKMQELQLKWKESGAVPAEKYRDLQNDYSRAVENFFYNLKIFRELQDHDLKKNFELKQAVLEKVKTLSANENNRELERLIRVYRNEWEEIGPVPHDKWPDLREEYRAAVDAVYTKIKSFYQSQEEQLKANLEKKRNLVEQAKDILRNLPENESGWNKQTEALIALQEAYRQAGRTNQQEGDEVWRAFRAVCDEFFEKKKEHYSVLKEKHAELKKKKLELIAKAEELQNSTDWRDTSEKLIRLQDSWKKIPPVLHADESRLFARFRKACNHFFDAKKNFFAEKDAQYTGNLALKEEILSRLNAFTLSGDVANDRNNLRNFSDEWMKAGLVPMAEKKRINEAFYSRLDSLYEQLNLSEKEKAELKYQNKLERLKGSENPRESLRKELDYIRKQMDEANSSMRTYENNLGFFKNAKSDNPLFAEVNGKIDAEKRKLESWKEKLNLVRSAINEMEAANS